MRREINRRIRYACESGNSRVINVLLLTKDNRIILIPESAYCWSQDYIWLATFSPGEGYVGTTKIDENEPWLLVLVDECIQKIIRRDVKK